MQGWCTSTNYGNEKKVLKISLVLKVSISVINCWRSSFCKSYHNIVPSFSRTCKHSCHDTSCHAPHSTANQISESRSDTCYDSWSDTLHSLNWQRKFNDWSQMCWVKTTCPDGWFVYWNDFYDMFRYARNLLHSFIDYWHD